MRWSKPLRSREARRRDRELRADLREIRLGYRRLGLDLADVCDFALRKLLEGGLAEVEARGETDPGAMTRALLRGLGMDPGPAPPKPRW